MTKRKYYPIAMGISKKGLSGVKKSLRRAGYCKLTTAKDGKYFNVFYSNKCKRKK